MNHCHNCKFIKYKEHSENECKFYFTFDLSNGMYDKQYKVASKIREEREICPNYEHSKFMKLKIRLGWIQRWWYSKKYPQTVATP